MKRLLKRLTSNCLFSVNGNLYKEIDGCFMESPLSVDIEGIFMRTLERPEYMSMESIPNLCRQRVQPKEEDPT